MPGSNESLQLLHLPDHEYRYHYILPYMIEFMCRYAESGKFLLPKVFPHFSALRYW